MAETLEELKARNAAEDAEAQQTTENAETEEESTTDPQSVEDETTGEAVDDETEEPDEAAETSEGEAEESETEEWMQSDSHESENAEKKYTGSDIGAAKAKLRGKLERKHNRELEEKDSENSELRQEIEALKAQVAGGNSSPSNLERPKREDFLDADDPEEAFFDALSDWKLNRREAELSAQAAATQQEQEQQAFKQSIDKSVDQHYERAVTLAEKSGITPETYQAADYKVRQMVESIKPGYGDMVVDGLIATLGDGSEKVMYNIGINDKRLNQLREYLVEDPTAWKAVAWLGGLNNQLSAPLKRKTNAPKPAADPKGDVKGGASERAAKKQYDKAHKDGDFNKAFNLKRQAKKDGFNTSDW